MFNMDDQTIDGLVNEALEVLTEEKIYEMALEHIDMDVFAKWNDEPPTAEAVGKVFALAGFISGMKFTMENLEYSEDE